MELYVLKNGAMLGPFAEGELIAQIEAGKFTAEDLAQRSGTPYWTPLGKLFNAAPADNEIVTEAGLQQRIWEFLRTWFERRTLRTALFCLAAGLVFFLISLVPALIWLPWFAAAFLASLLLMRSGDLRRGAMVCAAAAFLPVLFGVLVTGAKKGSIHAEAIASTHTVPAADVAAREARPVASPAAPPQTIPDLPITPPAPADPVVESREPIQAQPLEAQPQGQMAAASAPAAGSQTTTTPASSEPESGGFSAMKDKLMNLLPSRTPTPAPTESPATGASPTSDTSAPPMADSPLPPPPLPDGIAQTPPSTDLPKDAAEGVKPVPVLDPEAARLVRDYRNSLVFVDDANGATGSGFICEFDGKPYLFSNIHVVSAMRSPSFTRLDRSPLRVGAAAAAVAHDIVRYEVPAGAAEAGKPLQAMKAAESVAAIGDDVIVLGNSEGAHVILPLVGKISGIGPNLVEVTAEFVPGNSGSPIIHKKTGQVIGLATYAVRRDMDWLSERTSDTEKAKKIRRFGYRIDSVQTWQPVNWRTFSSDVAEMERISGLTKSLAAVLDDIGDDGLISRGRHQHPAIRRQIEMFVDQISKRSVSSTDRLRSKQNFLADLRAASQNDLAAARSRVAYDYFRRSLGEEEKAREQFRTIFDRLMKAQR
jgi:hypothetical protein